MMKTGSILMTALLLAATPALGQSPQMSFFLTSAGPGDGANLGGLAGADAHCQMLAESAGSTGMVWRAYLSTTATDAMPAVNARDRIGNGPWYNYNGDIIAHNLDELHGNNSLTKATQLTENGDEVNGRGDDPNQHDILTGSRLRTRWVLLQKGALSGSERDSNPFALHHRPCGR